MQRCGDLEIKLKTMFEEETLLILGAAASKSYQFPLGKDLIDKIIADRVGILTLYEEYIKDECPDIRLLIGSKRFYWGDRFDGLCTINFKDIFIYKDGKYRGPLLRDRSSEKYLSNQIISRINNSPLKNEEVLKFVDDFLKINFSLIQPTRSDVDIEKFTKAINKYFLAILFFQRLEEFDPLSIDFFLSVHKEFNYENSNIGKFAIAYEINKCQQNLDKKFERNSENSNWYKYLLNQILNGCQSSDPEIDNRANINDNSLSVITFNYDTSLEWYLESRLSNMQYFKGEKNENEAIKYVNNFKDNQIKHVYGKIDVKESPGSISIEESQNIRVIADERNKEYLEQVKKFANEKIKSAQRVFILGCALYTENNDIIGLEKLFDLQVLQTGNVFSLLRLKKSVVVTNYQNSEIINKTLRSLILNKVPEKHRHNFLTKINLEEVQNLTIITKPIDEAIGSDFDFS